MNTPTSAPQPSASLTRLVQRIRAANRDAKAAPVGSPERRESYRTKASMISNVIVSADPSTFSLRYHGRTPNGEPLVLVTVFAKRKLACFHTPLDCLGGVARRRVLDALGPVAETHRSWRHP